jgi:antitoxin component of RelBE/YafQ-DinJ toxin-antitoxin module
MKKGNKKMRRQISKSQLVWARVNEFEKELVRKVASALGISISEYIRYLVMRDLEERSIYTTRVEAIKEEMRKTRE